MYYLLSLLISALIAVMIVINGSLTDVLGVYLATVCIHIVGLIAVSAACYLKKTKLRPGERLSPGFFLGGAIGVATTVFNNMAFGKISVSAILALGLLGQAITALFIDQYGLFGMPVRPFTPAKLAGLAFTLAGVTFLLWGSPFAPLPVAVSFLAGVTVITSRNCNAMLSQKTGELAATWFNYAIGLGVSLVAFAFSLLLGEKAALSLGATRPWMYLGALLGATIVFLTNIATMKLPAFYMTLILCAGQLFAGMALDALMGRAFSAPMLLGGVLVAAGFGLNLWLDDRAAKRA